MLRVISTGSGLKDVAGAMKAVTAVGTRPLTIPPRRRCAVDGAARRRLYDFKESA